MSKIEKIFWGALILAAGVVIGAVVASLLAPAKKASECFDGHSTQISNGVGYKTYIPALDTCE